MEDKFQEEMEQALEDAKMDTLPDGKFEGELFLSTDGKNTVHIKADTRDGREAGLKWAKAVYEGLKIAYGTKQQLNAETYKEKGEMCAIHNVEMKRSKKGNWYHKEGNQICVGKGYFEAKN